MLFQAEWLPQYKTAIAAAKKRLAGKRLTTRHPAGYKGIARVHTKTVEEMTRDREAATKQAAEADKAKKRPAAKKKP